MSKPNPPEHLGDAGRSVWRSIVGKYEMRADELVTLEDVCTISDMLAELDKAWAEDDRPMTTGGSMGQLVIHPLIGEIRAQKMARNALWRQLKLPDDASGAAPAVNQQRDAANSKWATGRGRGA